MSSFIGIENQFVMSLRTTSLSRSMFPWEDFNSLSIIEFSGNILPEYIIDFYTRDDDLIRYLHEENTIFLTIGTDLLNLSNTIPIHPKETNVSPSGTDKKRVTIRGILYAKNKAGDSSYLNTRKMRIVNERQHGLTLLREIANNYFYQTVDPTNANRNFIMDDKQLEENLSKQSWIQSSETDQAFINRIWLHMNSSTEIPIIGITYNNYFRLFDLVKMFRFPTRYVSWIFTKKSNVGGNIMYNDSHSIKMGDYQTSHNYAYGRMFNDENMLSEKQRESYFGGNKLLSAAGSKKPTIDPLATGLYTFPKYINTNVHNNYWKVYHERMIELLSFDLNMIRLNFIKRFIPIHPLDLVFFETLKPGTDSINDNLSGYYIISQVERKFDRSSVSTKVILNRNHSTSIVKESEKES